MRSRYGTSIVDLKVLPVIFELRLYSVAPGRMADCHARFRDHFPALFRRHGIACIGRWTATAGPDAPRFVYMMAYQSYAEREACWDSFYKDDEWWRLRAETNAGSEMIERHDLYFLKANTSWKDSGTAIKTSTAGLHELVFHEVAAGQSAAATAFLESTWLPALREAGATIMAVFDMASGVRMPQVVLLYAWRNATHRESGWAALNNNKQINEAWDEQRRKLGHTILTRSEVNLLEPSAYALPFSSI